MLGQDTTQVFGARANSKVIVNGAYISVLLEKELFRTFLRNLGFKLSKLTLSKFKIRCWCIGMKRTRFLLEKDFQIVNGMCAVSPFLLRSRGDGVICSPLV